MKYLYIFLSLIAAVLIYGAVQVQFLPFTKESQWVVAFAPRQAEYLGLDAKIVWQGILSDLKPQQVRLQANWNDIEQQSGEFNFSELDWYINSVAEKNIKVTLAVGRKLPRWPECHDPIWLSDLKPWEVRARHLTMLKKVVEHYQSNPIIIRWQLENEPLFAFGKCGTPNFHLLREERDLIKSLDSSRPILMTDSGEISPWLETSILADEQGVTMYRVTWDKTLGYFRYFWSPFFYRFKAALVLPFVNKTVISELQMEPWAPSGLNNLSYQEAQKSFSLAQFEEHTNFARTTGLSEAFVWGVEWWYGQKLNGRAEYWEEGKKLFRIINN
ncbi:MAG: hypothetical protein AAB657_03900 [Patescibacteria group bacterium]